MTANSLFPTHEDRYKTARFIRPLSGGDAEFRLLEAVEGSQTVVIGREELEGLNFEKNTQYQIFLTSKTQAGGNWVGFLWPKDENPWLTRDLPEIDTEIVGTVSYYIPPYAVILDIEHKGKTLIGYLNRENLPERQSLDITKTLFLGDRICGHVSSYNEDRLQLAIDVKDWVKSRRAEARAYNKIASDKNLDDVKLSPLKSETPAPLKGVRLLLADDDKRLLNDLEVWLRRAGAEVKTATTPWQVAAILKEFQPSHALLDYKMPEIQDFESCIKHLRSADAHGEGTHIAILSGYENFDPKVYGCGYLAKPATLQEIVTWIQTLKVATREDVQNSSAHSEEQDHWSLRQRRSNVITTAQKTLEGLCERHSLTGAAWFIQHSEGAYELRAQTSKITQKAVEAELNRLGQSVVGAACYEQKLLKGVVPSNDPLYELSYRLCGGMNPHYVALPISVEGLSPRLVLFINDQPFSEETTTSIAARHDHFELLIRYLQQEQHNDSIETFATLGLSASASLHEIRSKLQGLLSIPDALSLCLQGEDVSEKAESLIQKLDEDVESLITLSKEGLKSLHNRHRAILNPVNIAKKVVRDTKEIREKVFERQKVNILFQNELGARVLTHLSPIAIEQALLNLIGNALTILPNEDWAQIVVSVCHDQNDLKRPIHIYVEDNGPGMTAQQIDRLFEARETGKTYGTGLGLFISRALARSLGGELELMNSVRWGGSRFCLSLPVILGDHNDKF